MKEQVKTPVLIAVAVIAAIVLIAWGSKMMAASNGDLDQGQIKYTPGKPPWEETDPSKKGPGAAPGGPPSSGVPSTSAVAKPPANLPVGAPSVNNAGH